MSDPLHLFTNKQRDREFRIEKLLVEHGLWEKVESYKDILACSLCEKKIKDGDRTIFCLGKPIHRDCIKKLRQKKG